MQRLSLWERLPLVKHLSPRRRSVMRSIMKEVDAAAAQLQIESLLARRPAQLSGGQRQRVALGRAMVRHPAVFLMDEPLSNLDAKLRVHMRSELAELHARLGATFVYVTHDQVEAMTMSDRVAMMHAGSIVQLGTPAELYARPANLTVAQFIGSPAINVLPGRVEAGGRIVVAGATIPVDASLPVGSRNSLGLRAEANTPLEAGCTPRDAVCIGARLRRIENLGAEYIVHCDVDGLEGVVVTCRVPAERAPAGDGALALAFSPRACHVFDATGERVRFVDDARQRERQSLPSSSAPAPNPIR
jgi:multiple sugar transport system ATP-binding protein